MPKKSIKSRMIKAIVFLALITTILASAGLGLFLNNQSKKNQSAELLQNTNSVADKLAIFLSENEIVVSGLAKNRDLIQWIEKTGDKTEITPWLNSLNFEKRFSAIYVLNKDGLTTASTDPTFLGNNYGFRKYAATALKGQNGFEMAIGATSHQPGYYFSSPVLDKDNVVIGALIFKMVPGYLHNLLLREVWVKNKKIMLCDQNGVVIYSNVQDRIYKSLGPISKDKKENLTSEKTYSDLTINELQYPQPQLLIEKNISEPQLSIFFDSTDNMQEVIAIAPINQSRLFLTVESEVTNFTTIATLIANSEILLFSFFLLTLLILFIINRSLAPLNQLIKMTDNISQGNFDQKNPINSQDELEELGKSIEEMSNKLKNYYFDLEIGINDKTKELTEKNKSIEGAEKAIMNILEDVQIEKTKTGELAKDLEKFKLALDNSSDSVVITDKEGTVIYVNNGAQNITGFTLDEIIGTKAGVKWGGLMLKNYYEKMWKTIKDDKKIFSDIIKNHRKNGDVYDASISISPVLNELNEVAFFVCVERDVTKEKEVDRAKTEFVSLASHQLRTPLSSINWYTEMLLDGDAGKITKKQKEFLDEIYTGSKRMVELVNALLNVSRLELGTFAIIPSPTNIIEISDSVLHELQVSIVKKELKIKTTYEKDLPQVSVDPGLTRVIFQNLLSNAVKYTPEKGKIDVSIKTDKKNLNISVSDTGFGIPAKQKNKIFTKLFRADNVKEQNTEGTGLGLYIVKSILDSSGGSISFESVENKGTTFNITIPLSGMSHKEGLKTLT